MTHRSLEEENGTKEFLIYQIMYKSLIFQKDTSDLQDKSNEKCIKDV